MIRTLSPRRLSLVLLLVLYLVLGSAAHAQISFVQISDPHLFDDTSTTADNRWNNKAAFVSCIDKINQEVQNNAKYRFVVITGDLGLEPLVAGVTDRKQIESNLRNGAAEFASMLVLSRVHHWLFVPGNNDLLNEELKNIEYYHLFLDALREATKRTLPDFEIQDLCPKGDTGPDGYQSRSDVLKIDKYAFIGFDDSSFKNSEKNAGDKGMPGQRRIDRNAGLQERYAKLVRAHLDQPDITNAYIFYHIPATDDPYLVTLKPEDEHLKPRYAAKDQIGGAYFHSAWFVNSKVRIAWNGIVIHRKVRGLFAGHFHDNRRQTYQSLAWLTSDYLPDEVEKLHVCPPLSLRLQNDKAEQARGFQEVYVDKEGQVSTRIVWLSPSPWGLTPVQNDPATAQFELGQTFEGLDRLDEAEAAYAKAADSDWPPTREMAREALTGVLDKKEWIRNKYFWSPLDSIFTAFATAAIPIIPIVLLAVCTYLWGKRRGRNRVRIGPVVDAANGNAGIRFDQVAGIVLKRIHTHFKPRGPISNDVKLPMLVKSQSPEIKEIIETTAPGNVGKLLNWALGLRNRPRYSIQGIADSNSLGRWLFISLDYRGERLGDWKKETLPHKFMVERTLAFRALRRLIQHMNQ